MKIKINEAKLKRIVEESIKEVLNEGFNKSMSFGEYQTLMGRIGFECKLGSGSRKVFINPKYHGSIVRHAHSLGMDLPAGALQQTVDDLTKMGWFEDPENRKIFPYEEFGISPSDIKYDRTQEEIDAANKKYKDAEIIPVFQEKDSICVLKIDKNHVNLCKNAQDRRPLLNKWFDKFEYDRQTSLIPCLKYDNEDKMETEAYPINVDGSLDVKHMMIENKNYGKSSNKRNGKFFL